MKTIEFDNDTYRVLEPGEKLRATDCFINRNPDGTRTLSVVGAHICGEVVTGYDQRDDDELRTRPYMRLIVDGEDYSGTEHDLSERLAKALVIAAKVKDLGVPDDKLGPIVMSILEAAE